MRSLPVMPPRAASDDDVSVPVVATAVQPRLYPKKPH